MTVLSTVQDACKVVGLAVPSVLYSSTQRDEIEMRTIAEEMADRIARGHDWQLLSKIETITGDGTDEDFALPDDYDRMLVKSQVWSSSLETPLTHISSLDRWLGLDVQSFDFIINAWTIYGGEMNIKPALADTVTAKYFYQSNLIVDAASLAEGDRKTTFDTDTDIFRLDERLLKLGIIWRWKEYKGQAYAEALEDYEELKERLVVRDKGSKIIKIGHVRYAKDTTVAYPQNIDVP